MFLRSGRWINGSSVRKNIQVLFAVGVVVVSFVDNIQTLILKIAASDSNFR